MFVLFQISLQPETAPMPPTGRTPCVLRCPSIEARAPGTPSRPPAAGPPCIETKHDCSLFYTLNGNWWSSASPSFLHLPEPWSMLRLPQCRKAAGSHAAALPLFPSVRRFSRVFARSDCRGIALLCRAAHLPRKSLYDPHARPGHHSDVRPRAAAVCPPWSAVFSGASAWA